MRALITGGCGFIGTNTADRLAGMGWHVTLYDNFERRGAERNRDWLRSRHAVRIVRADVRDHRNLERVVADGRFDVAIHLASQVAVTTAVKNPRHDFEVNAGGTFNLLEAVRQHSPETIVLNASTNKVYGKLADLHADESATRYELPRLPHGVPETQPLDFHSPYGCSKGAADQYVMDYARIYGLRTVNFRQSCIYGPHQFGMEDQGWVAWFSIAHSLGQPVTVYGTGKQVRDVLHVDDLIDAYIAAIDNIDTVAGMSFNIGGGPHNTISLLELFDLLEAVSGKPVERSLAAWRPGDQPVYISDIRRAEQMLWWTPSRDAQAGVESLWNWVTANRSLFTTERAVAVAS
ncbi:MAG: SDR family NAD(P)-dependent oxidoreductase [Bryobacterales bacterium]|nr:SDR family NAD(P)-dependent oxidoreductase [Bryobacterales bacterium]